jgi:hypothetical protein
VLDTLLPIARCTRVSVDTDIVMGLPMLAQLVERAVKHPTVSRAALFWPMSHRFLSSQRPKTTSTSLFDSASDFMHSLRVKATNALTATLSVQEREQLFSRLTPPQQEKQDGKTNDDRMDMEHSIAEAVAAARAQEAKKQEDKWSKTKEAIEKEAEEAARERVENEFKIQRRRIEFERWQTQVEEEKQRRSNKSKVEAAPGPVTRGEVVEQSVESEINVHPVLGAAIADFGHKRIHVVSAHALSTIPVWKKQRIYRHDRAKAMASDKMKTLHLGMPGIIGLHEDLNGKLSIIDGQHRVGMMTILHEKCASHDDFDLDRVLVEVYPQNPDHVDTHAQDLFLEVNKAEPVKLVDMPGVAKGSDRKIISEGAERIAEKYAEMFKSSQKCRPPHLNIDNLRDALFASNAIKRHNLKTSKAVEAWMLAKNQSLADLYKDPAEQEKVSKTAYEKAKKFEFYLGLDLSWLYK